MEKMGLVKVVLAIVAVIITVGRVPMSGAIKCFKKIDGSETNTGRSSDCGSSDKICYKRDAGSDDFTYACEAPSFRVPKDPYVKCGGKPKVCYCNWDSCNNQKGMNWKTTTTSTTTTTTTTPSTTTKTPDVGGVGGTVPANEGGQRTTKAENSAESGTTPTPCGSPTGLYVGLAVLAVLLIVALVAIAVLVYQRKGKVTDKPTKDDKKEAPKEEVRDPLDHDLGTYILTSVPAGNARKPTAET